MTGPSGIRHVFPPENFIGELAVGVNRVPVSLTASAGVSGRLKMDVEPISTSTCPSGVRALIRSFDRSRNTIDEFSLDCQSSDGKRLISDTVYLVGYNRSSQGLNVRLRTRDATLKMAAAQSRDRPALCFWLLGFACFPPVHVTAGLGSVVARGATQATGTDEITGCIAAEGPAGSEPDTWRNSAEHMLKHLRSVLVFARGSPLPVPVTEFHVGNLVEATFYETGGGHISETPSISHLNLEPIVRTAVTNVDAVDAYRDAFEIAIGWFAVPTTIDEIRLLSGMTALEAVAARCIERKHTFISQSSDFRRLAKYLRRCVNQYTELDDEKRKATNEKISELNRRSFRYKIEALLNHWNVPRESIESDVIADLVRLRNSIVHKGSVSRNKDLWLSILVVREIVARLVFSMLQYEGSYQCYIEGFHMRHFPDCTPVS